MNLKLFSIQNELPSKLKALNGTSFIPEDQKKDPHFNIITLGVKKRRVKTELSCIDLICGALCWHMKEFRSRTCQSEELCVCFGSAWAQAVCWNHPVSFHYLKIQLIPSIFYLWGLSATLFELNSPWRAFFPFGYMEYKCRSEGIGFWIGKPMTCEARALNINGKSKWSNINNNVQLFKVSM